MSLGHPVDCVSRQDEEEEYEADGFGDFAVHCSSFCPFVHQTMSYQAHASMKPTQTPNAKRPQSMRANLLPVLQRGNDMAVAKSSRSRVLLNVLDRRS